MNDCAVVTIVQKNYFTFAEALAKSVKRFHPGIRVYVLLADRPDDRFDAKAKSFDVITLDDVRIPHIEKYCFCYNAYQRVGFLKSFALEYLFEKYHFKKIIYFDSDIYVKHDISFILDLLNDYSVIITPHIIKPQRSFRDSKGRVVEESIVAGPVFNAGILGLSNTDEGLNAVRWLKERTIPFKGKKLFDIEQTWFNLLPLIFKNVYILKNPGCNLAYWNLHERDIRTKNSAVQVDGEPLYFFHFSGVTINDIGSISKCIRLYNLGYRLDMFPALIPVFEEYRDLHLSLGFHDVIKWPCAFDRFDTGEPIKNHVREYFLANEKLWNASLDPFVSRRLKLVNRFCFLFIVLDLVRRYCTLVRSFLKRSLSTANWSS